MKKKKPDKIPRKARSGRGATQPDDGSDLILELDVGSDGATEDIGGPDVSQTPAAEIVSRPAPEETAAAQQEVTAEETAAEPQDAAPEEAAAEPQQNEAAEENAPVKQKEDSGKKQKRAIIVIAAMLALLFGGLFLTMQHYLNKINRVNEVETISPEDEDFETDENNGLQVLSPDDLNWDSISPLGDEELINILFVGQDRRPGEDRQRSDTMILCSINPRKKAVSLISFLRDLYVQIPGYTDNRLNSAYAFGGFPLLMETLNKNFGITVDGCFEVDFDGFIALIDEIDGVDITLTAEEAKVVGNGAVEGENHLNGTDALEYARIRKLDSDFGRTNRQRKVLLAAYDRIRYCTLQQLLSLLDKALPCMTTDMTNAQIFSLASKVFQLLTNIDIHTYSVPPDGTYSYSFIRGMSILYPNLKAIREILANQYMPF